MKMRFLIFSCFNLIFYLSSIVRSEENTCNSETETCNTKIEEKPSIKYRDLFAKVGDEGEKLKNSFPPGANFTDYYDFTIDDGELNSLISPRSSLYPSPKFKNTNQGNFLHFFKVAYEKRLPAVFTTDAYTEGLIKSYQRMVKIFFEEVFIHYLKKFSDNMLHYIKSNKDSNDRLTRIRFDIDSVQSFYSILSYLAGKGVETFEVDKDIESEYLKWKSAVDNFQPNAEVFFLGKRKKVNYSKLVPKGFWRQSQRLSNVYQFVQFLIAHGFHIDDELKSIWVMGKLIVDADLVPIFQTISMTVKYFIGQDNLLPNVVEIGKCGNSTLSDYVLDTASVKYLKENCFTKQKISLAFLDQMIMWNKVDYDRISVEREKTTHLLHSPYSVISWVINKFTDLREDHDRRITSYYEINQVLTQNNVYNYTINNRMKGVKTSINEIVIELRDKVDYKPTLEAVHKILNNSYVMEEEQWRTNTQNHFIFLIEKANRANKNIKSENIEKNNYDSLYYSKEFRKKSFNLGAATASSFNFENKVFTKYINNKYVNGEIPEIYVEPALEYYEEILELVKKLEWYFHIIIETVETSFKINFRYVRTRLSTSLEDIKYSADLLRTAIVSQKNMNMTQELRDTLRTLIYSEEISETWDGWFARLYDIDNQISIFNFESYNLLLNIIPPDEKKGFPGLYHYIFNKYNNIGISLVKDAQENVDKLMLWPGSNFGEQYFMLSEKNQNEIIKNIIEERKN